MAKVKSLAVRGSVGKLGGMVYYNTSGVSLQREEAASVANPNTAAQVNTRSKFKLMSQLSASMKREIAIPRKGLQSSRNRFVNTNFDLVTYADGAATIDLNKVQLTDSRRPMGVLSVDRSRGTAIQCRVAVKPALYEKIVVCAYRKSDDEKLEYVGSSIADVDASGTTVLSLPYTTDAVVTYAYGIAYSSAAARAKYGNLEADPAQQVASLVQSSSVTAGAARFSKTIGCTMNVGSNSATTEPFDFSIESVNNTSEGYVSLRANGNEIEISNNIRVGSVVSLVVKEYTEDGSEKEIITTSNVEVNGNRITFSIPSGAAGDFLAEVIVTIDDSSKSKEYYYAPSTVVCNFTLPAHTYELEEKEMVFYNAISASSLASIMTVMYNHDGVDISAHGMMLEDQRIVFRADGHSDYLEAVVDGTEVAFRYSGLGLPDYVVNITVQGYNVIFQ